MRKVKFGFIKQGNTIHLQTEKKFINYEGLEGISKTVTTCKLGDEINYFAFDDKRKYKKKLKMYELSFEKEYMIYEFEDYLINILANDDIRKQSIDIKNECEKIYNVMLRNEKLKGLQQRIKEAV